MAAFYTVGNEDGTRFLTTISNNYISMQDGYYNCIQTTQAIATSFKAYCQTKQPTNTFYVYEIDTTITKVGN